MKNLTRIFITGLAICVVLLAIVRIRRLAESRQYRQPETPSARRADGELLTRQEPTILVPGDVWEETPTGWSSPAGTAQPTENMVATENPAHLPGPASMPYIVPDPLSLGGDAADSDVFRR